jgi:alpha-N-arabinofuranosidase
MRRLPPGPIRWPGGCFADSYDWRDGVGTPGQRPRRTNFWANDMASLPDGLQMRAEYVRHERVHALCRLPAAPAPRRQSPGLPARDFNQWVEYCNSSAGSTGRALREQGGEREPFGVRYWGVGNESWGCGGNFSPEDYAVEYRRFTAWVPRFGVDLAFIGSGPNAGDLAWTRRFLARMTERGDGALGGMWGWALHHYSWNTSRGATSDWTAGKGDALNFTTDEWYEMLNEADRMDGLITGHWAVMGEFDRRRRVSSSSTRGARGTAGHGGRSVAPVRPAVRCVTRSSRP